jgi:tRNA pseudouridine55 synthase
MSDMSGLFLVDKPAGPSSFGVLRMLRPALGRKLGHAGTLDPFATGLLLVLAGRATRLARYLSGLDKSYTAELQLGAVSSTLDPEGEIEATGRRTGEAELRAAAQAMVGEIEQRVPAASAVKVGGRRAYALMRGGEQVDAGSRTVRIDRLELTAFDTATQRATIDVVCSKGTYVRQIAGDLGAATGAGAYCRGLRRLTVGPFVVDDAGPPDAVIARPDGPWHRSPADALPHLPERELTAEERIGVEHGRPVATSGEPGAVRLVCEGRLVAVAEPRDGRLRPVVVL